MRTYPRSTGFRPQKWLVPGFSGLLIIGFILIQLAFSAPKEMTVKIEGMVCSSCIGIVSKKLTSLPEIEKAEVDLQTGKAKVTFSNLFDGKVEPLVTKAQDALQEAGYRLSLE